MKKLGWIITALVAAFLVFDGVGKVLKLAHSVEGTIQLGYPETTVVGIGLALLVSTVLYIIPRTTVLGAILVTGYLGGATATQVRLEDPWFLFPVAIGVLVWTGLYFRDEGLRALIPLRS